MNEQLENDIAAIGGKPSGAAKPGPGSVDYKAECERLERELQSTRVEGGRVKKLDADLKAAQERIAELEQKDLRAAAIGELPDSLKDVPDDIKETAILIARGMVEKANAQRDERVRKLEERVEQDESSRRQRLMGSFMQRVNESFPGFVESIKGDKKAAWEKYQVHNYDTIHNAIERCDYDTLAYHIQQFYASNDLEIPSGGQGGAVAPDPRAAGGGKTQVQTSSKTYTVEEWCRIKEDAQVKHQDGKITFKEYSDICEELSNAYKEGRVK